MHRKRKIPFGDLEDEIRKLILYPDSPYARLESRVGRYPAQRRCFIENGLYSGAAPRKFQRLRRLRRWFHRFEAVVLKLSGQHRRGRRNTLELHLETPEITVPGLHPSLDGLQILHLADFHVDLNPGVIERAIFLIEGIDFDLAVHTGDFFDASPVPTTEQIEAYQNLLAATDGQLFAVPGNHDTFAAVEALESAGVHFLLNESVELVLRGEAIFLAGVEDPHTFAGDDFSRFRGIDDSSHRLRILLAHSPECYRESEASGFQLQLSGHTHGGQVCWPGGQPVIGNCQTPRSLLSGAWQHGRLRGYTSRGAGSGQYPVRFNCPPEITRITLRAENPTPTA